MQKKYFPNLNGLRFIGAFMVIIGHLEFVKSLNDIPNFMNLSFYLNTNGHLGVILFFVLSGFLITYLLMDELELNNKIHLGKFYMRRILRIWPLYFFMVVLSIWLLPPLFKIINFNLPAYQWNDYKYYLFFIPNLAKATGHYIDGAVHLWSIGVEEQFYLVWPLLILLFRKYLFILLVIIFVGISGLPFFLDFIHSHSSLFNNKEDLFSHIHSFVVHFKINSMAIGGIFAYAFKHNKKWFNFAYNKIFILFICSVILFLWISGIVITSMSDEVYSIFFGLIIFSLSTSPKPFYLIENKVFNFLGSISYGLYVYHWIIIVFFIYILKLFIPNYKEEMMLFNIYLYALTITFTILISYFSFRYLEKPLLQIKKKFEV